MRKDLNQMPVVKNRIEELENKKTELFRQVNFEGNHHWYLNNIDPINEELERLGKELRAIEATNVNVGDGITLNLYSDSHAFTIIERKDTPKGFKLKIQRDEAIRTDNYGMSDCQHYEYKMNEKGRIEEIQWNAKKNWFSTPNGCRSVSLGRNEYFDYSF